MLPDDILSLIVLFLDQADHILLEVEYTLNLFTGIDLHCMLITITIGVRKEDIKDKLIKFSSLEYSMLLNFLIFFSCSYHLILW